MRDAQSLLIDYAVPIQNQIEVQGARGARVRTFTSEIALDLEKRLEQLAWRLRGVPNSGGVEKPRLVAHAYRRGVVEG